jgi:hypothetical protein
MSAHGLYLRTSLFVSLGPGTPGVLSVIESRYANATRQTIALVTHGKTPGENQLQIDVFGLTNEGASLETTLPDLALNEVDLYSEAQGALPDVPLRISLNYMQNNFGPFGYAVGRSTQGDTCVYAWQRIATPDRKLSLVNSRVALSVRLRLCDPKASEAALAATMMNLSANVSLSGGSWTPEPRELSADIGAAGAPIAPTSILASAANPLPPSSPSTARRRRPIPASACGSSEPLPAVPGIQQPDASRVIVPPPPVSSVIVPPAAVVGPAIPPQKADVPPPPKETPQ